jgi:RNA polymerase sigma-70 factor (ECF subfamily)
MLVRRDLCEEAIRLTRILASHPACGNPKTHGLLALMLFHSSRLASRTDDLGNLLLLREQDRTTWDGRMIREGFSELERSASGDRISHYQIEAGIAACHCIAPRYEDTDWRRILDLYDLLLQTHDSPVVSLNRIVALSHVEGPEAGMRALTTLSENRQIRNYYLFHAVRGEMYERIGDRASALHCYAGALERTQSTTERIFLEKRIKELGSR